MSPAYSDYCGVEGVRRFAEIASDFDFGRFLPRASFPEAFVEAYLDQFSEGDAGEFFTARYPSGDRRLMLDGIFDPAHIHSQNAIVAGSSYAPPGSRILPPSHYAFADAWDDRSRHLLLVNLDRGQAEYGWVHAWHLAHDPLGTGDNTSGLGHVANGLREFLDGLSAEDASQSRHGWSGSETP